MRARDLIIDFINFVFFLTLVSVFIIYFALKDNFEILGNILRTVAPISVFFLILLLKAKMDRHEFVRRRSHGDLNMVLNFDFKDKVILDIVLFASPIIILLLPLMVGFPDYIDILQAATVFLIFYYWQRYLFSKNS